MPEPSQNGSSDAVVYDRNVLVEVLIYHWRDGITGCGCGWAELGKSWPEHVATVYEESVVAHGLGCDAAHGA